MKLYKKGVGHLAFLFNIPFLLIFLFLVVLMIVIIKVTYIPEHCVSYSEEVKRALNVKGVEISKVEKSSNQICFRTKDMNLVKEIYKISKDIELKKVIEKEETKRFVINRFFNSSLPYLILGTITLIIIVYIISKKK